MKPFEIEIEPAQTEPITLDEVKKYISVDFDDWDELLHTLITTAIELSEGKSGKLYTRRNVTIKNNCLKYRIYPYLPFVSEEEDEELKTYTYVAGYATIPEKYKTAIMKRVATAFEHRSDIDQALSILANSSYAIEMQGKHYTI
jgi:hypothetical protein